MFAVFSFIIIITYLFAGNDVMDALFWITIRPKNKKREHLGTLYHWILGCIYTVIHSASFLIQAICLRYFLINWNRVFTCFSYIIYHLIYVLPNQPFSLFLNPLIPQPLEPLHVISLSLQCGYKLS